MRRIYRHLVLFALLSVFISLGMTTSNPESSLAQTATKPNILFILADDMRASDLQHMPKTQSFVATKP